MVAPFIEGGRHPKTQARVRLFNASAFSPLSLFASGEQGAWYDPSDLSTLYQDSAGTTPVTADGDPVGLMLDKSQGLVRGSEQVVNGDFDFDVDSWVLYAASTITWVSGRALVASGTTGGSGYYQDLVLDSSKSYEIKGEVESDIGTSRLSIRQGVGGFGSVLVSVSALAGETKELKAIISGESGVRIYLNPAADGARGYYDRISVKELPGNHATQSTSASRPVYRTDGTLHWLEGDGVDDFLDSAGLVPYDGTQWFISTAMAVTGGETYPGPWRFLRDGGLPDVSTDNLLEEYAIQGLLTRKALIQRYPGAVIIYDQDVARPAAGENHVSWQTQGSVARQQVIPSQSAISDLGAKSLTSGNAKLSLFRGYSGNFMAGRIYGFVWLSGTPTDAERDSTNEYLMKLSGVTL